MKTKNIVLYVGIPGCGKSTEAEAQVRNSHGSTVRINKDDLRAMIYPGQKHTRQWEKMIIAARDQLVERYLYQDSIDQIIIDDTNLHPKHFQRMEEIANGHEKATGVRVKVSKQLFTDSENVELCHRRNEERFRTVPHTVIENMYHQYKKLVIEESGLPYPLKNTNGKPAIVCDIDGTLAHRRNRSPFDWGRVGEDTLDQRVFELVNFYSQSHDIILLSGRDSCCRKDTITWLEENSVPYDALLMRPIENTEPDYKIKENLYTSCVFPFNRVDLVIDDRMQVVRLWRALGLKCFQVEDGYFWCHVTIFPTYQECESIAEEIEMVDDDIRTEIVEDITETIFHHVRNT